MLNDVILVVAVLFVDHVADHSDLEVQDFEEVLSAPVGLDLADYVVELLLEGGALRLLDGDVGEVASLLAPGPHQLVGHFGEFEFTGQPRTPNRAFL